MSSKKAWPSVALIAGIVLTIIGALLIAGYIMEAYVARIGEPDQSLLFWYLPLLLVGLIAFVTGLSTGIWGFIRLRKINHLNPSNDSQVLK
jgi:hypothetical protein